MTEHADYLSRLAADSAQWDPERLRAAEDALDEAQMRLAALRAPELRYVVAEAIARQVWGDGPWFLEGKVKADSLQAADVVLAIVQRVAGTAGTAVDASKAWAVAMTLARVADDG